MTSRLTEDAYWDAGYAAHQDPVPLALDSFRNRADRRIVELIESVGLDGRRVLEVGAGNSAVLSCLAARHRDGEFAGLDYSPAGCALLARRAEREGVRIQVLHQDLFEPTPDLRERFDVIFSIGVVEHFTDLPSVLGAMRALLAPSGRMVTIIPNMAGVIGALTRRWNRAVYDLHVPHDRASLVKGHRDAGLDVTESAYLCSTNFGVLSSCFKSERDPGWTTYLWLTRLTKLLWRVEDVVGELPRTARFSPYIYAVSRHAA